MGLRESDKRTYKDAALEQGRVNEKEKEILKAMVKDNDGKIYQGRGQEGGDRQ